MTDTPSAHTTSKRLPDLRGLMIDLDGVVWEGDRVIPGAPEFFSFLRSISMPFVLITNNSTLRPAQYIAKLAGMGIAAEDHEVLASADATALYLRQRAGSGTRVFVIGEHGLRSALEGQGFVLAEDDVEYVVVGLDRQVDFRKLTLAVRLVKAGATFVGSNPDTTLPLPEGLIPGAGSFHALIRAATGVAPIVVGKPEPTMLLMAAERLGAEPGHVALIGDRLDTDIVGAKRAGVVAIMVLTGISTASEIERSEVKPDYLFADLPAVQAAIGGE